MVQDNRSLRALSVAIAVATYLGGCASLRAPSGPPALNSPLPSSPSLAPPPAPVQSQTSPSPQPPARENHLSPAARSLVAQAHTQLARGDMPAASSTLERALHIEPSNPLLWIELGRLRLAESDAHQAEICGRKALALASGDHGAQSQADRLLADALRAEGRNQEAREIENRPLMR
jgi:tetratricopeptide (TPR) repeat protein